LLSQSNPPLRQRRQRTNFSDQALQSLEDSFALNPYPDINERESLALRLKATEDRIQVWFQNKRARYRKRMQKENTNGTKKETLPKKQSTRAVLTVSPLENSPIRQSMGQTYDNNFNSTPISAYTRQAYKFNETSHLGYNRSMYDSGYLSMLSPSSFSFQSTPSMYGSLYHNGCLSSGQAVMPTPVTPVVATTRIPKSIFRPF